ncbi:fungal-specific transcription factor domain-containing protein [Podospora didyma]|uniref:Fungal-specific transcription factor domain-containing protein n=1 Tax=Podospora didyma TaxID=330526 RepID=A0AAE0U3Q3_9PEZI|nr:fungal-specific transcription factor domain-containing protein [Podospora didyma]
MDGADIFRIALGSLVSPRPPQQYFPRKPPPIPVAHHRRDESQNDVHRIAHTLTACCRCRQRKTRCDPTLPKCLPCERSGSVCEYFDTTKGKKVSRNYVVRLQEKVRQLEKEMAQFTDEDEDYPYSHEEMVRPGGMVRLDETDETPRYLGPSSGIAMTRLLMEEAKRYTESKRIADLIPAVRARRLDRANRMQSVVSMAGSISGPGGRKKSYPMVSAYPAPGLPSRQIADKLADVYNQRAQVFTPILHEKIFLDDLHAVFDGDKDPYKNFIVRMVMAISLQKLDTQYAGLADSYYLAAMQQFEEVVRPKDLKTLQCLVLIGQYSLLTPTRTAVYYVIGLATRICQQMGLGEEKTIALGISDPQTLDMRRRLSWIVTTNEFGLSHIMGRPSGFAKGDDLMDVQFFETVDDENINPDGIQAGPVCEKKLVAIHFCKMRLLQAELRRILYEKTRDEPRHESHPWFAQMERKLEEWRDSSPEKPEWFTGRYHSMIISLYRPSPQVPNPTSRAALKCYDSAHFIINLSSQQVSKAAVDITWIFLLTIYMSVNALLWSASYREVREQHPKEELEELVEKAVQIIEECSNRWPGSASASQLYTVFAKACMQSYDAIEETLAPGAPENMFNTPTSLDASSPDSDMSASASSQQTQTQPSFFNNASPFGYVFDSTPEEMAAQFAFDPNSPFNNQPNFRSNSIFLNPGTESNGRRFSYFPPDFTHSSDTPMADQHRMDSLTPPGATIPRNGLTPPPLARVYSAHASSPSNSNSANTLPTPPESLAPPSTNPSNQSLSPRLTGSSVKSAGSPTPTPTLPYASPTPMSLQASPSPVPGLKYEPPEYSQPMPPPRAPTFTIPPPPPQPNTQQRQLPTTVTDWFNPPPPFISPHAFSSGGGPPMHSGQGYWSDGNTSSPFSGFGPGSGGPDDNSYRGPTSGLGVSYRGPTSGLGVSSGGDGGFGAMFAVGAASGGFGDQYSYSQERHGSLSQEQQVELMGVLETDGLSEIDTFLNTGMGLGGGGIGGAVRWG